jgi:hypothetical protein
MKNTLLLLTFQILNFMGFGQDRAQPSQQNITIKWAPTGLILGSASLQAEYNFGGRNSLTAKIGLPVNARHSFSYEDDDAEFNMKATSFLAGYRTYFSKKHLRGLYYEPFVKYVYHSSEGVGSGMLNNRRATFSLMNNYSALGFGVQLGAQFFIGKHFVVDLFFLGPEINSASNSFKAVEVSNIISWNDAEAGKAEQDIRDFLDQFPIVRKKVRVMVDKENKRVTAEFKGAMPGIRTGFSVGFAF